MTINKTRELKFKIISFSIIFIFLFLYWFNSKDNFDIKISIREENFNSELLDNIYGKNLSEKLLQAKSIKSVYSVSSLNCCNIFIKFNFILNKSAEIQKIRFLLDDFISKTNLNPEIEFDFDYKNKYDCFILIFSNNKTNRDLAELPANICNKLMNLKYTGKNFCPQQFETINYIYFKDSDLLTYNITPSDIKNIIKENNINKNTTTLKSNNILNCASDIKNTENLGDLKIPYPDKYFSNSFKNVFYIKKTIVPVSDFSITHKEASLFGIKKHELMPFLLFKFLIKNKLNKDLPNYIKYKIINSKNLIKNISSKKEKTIIYKYNQEDLISYHINGKELTENILANNEGLFCDYYFENSKRIKIVLKNIQNSDFIYSKKYKNLINLSSVLKKEIKENYTLIIRKNGNII